MIKKIKNSLSIKSFLLTFLLITICSTITYVFIVCFTQYSYKYNIFDMEPLANELVYEMKITNKADAPIYFTNMKKIIIEKYNDEFVPHLFVEETGAELELEDLASKTGKNIDDYNKLERSMQHKLVFADDAAHYLFFIVKNTDKKSQIVESLNRIIPLLSICIFICSTIAAFFHSWYLTAPIKKISKIAEQMAIMDFRGRCRENRKDEIGMLAKSLNSLSDKLVATLSELNTANEKLLSDINKERRIERQRLDFFTAASHELKTPITIIKGQIQGMLYNIGRYKDRETYLIKSLEVVDALEKTVSEILTISRLDTPEYACKKEKINLSKLITERLLFFNDFFIEKDITLEKKLDEQTDMLADKKLLEKGIDNLIGNALIYSPKGNTIYVNVWRDGNISYFTIENTGVSIPEEELPKLCEAFFRVEQSRNRQTGGSGLGLYITRTILNLHGAKMQIANSPSGVIVTVQFC